MISKRAKEILQILADTEDYILTDGNRVAVGNTFTNWKILYQLLWACLISRDSYSPDIFYINSAGRKYLNGEAPYRCDLGHDHNTMQDINYCYNQRKI